MAGRRARRLRRAYAKQAGAEVFATVATAHVEYVRSLGANHVIDYQTERFEDIARDIELVLDYVGGEVLDRSWQVLTTTSVIVGTSSPDILARTPAGRNNAQPCSHSDDSLREHIYNEHINM